MTLSVCISGKFFLFELNIFAALERLEITSQSLNGEQAEYKPKVSTIVLKNVSIKAHSHWAFALAMICFDVYQHLSSLSVNSTIESNGSEMVSQTQKQNENARCEWALRMLRKYLQDP